jgi:hypothetical protein
MNKESGFMKFLRVLVPAIIVCQSLAVHAESITPVFAPPPGEQSHRDIFEALFGGEFQSVGNDYTNGFQTLTRVDDSKDQHYDFDAWFAKVVAKWAAASQGFGTEDDGLLFTVTGYQNNVAGAASDPDGGEGIVFKRFGVEFGTVQVTTDPTLNPGGRDHVVTYSYEYTPVDSVEAQMGYLLFFEDISGVAGYSDWDYNDLVVDLRSVVDAQGQDVPEPGSLVLMAAGAIALLPRRRRKADL